MFIISYIKGETKMINEWEMYWRDPHLFEWLVKMYKENHGYKRLASHILLENRHTLELGAGSAYLSRILKNRGCWTTAIDNSYSVVANNKNMVDNYVWGDVFELPFSDKEFDLGVSCGLLEHFNLEDAQKIIKETRRVSKYQIHFYPRENWLWRLWWWVRKVPDKTYKHNPYDLGLEDIIIGEENFGLLNYYYVKGR